MRFMDFIKSITAPESKTSLNSIHKALSEDFPNKTDEELLQVACIAGLLARVVYADMKLESGELEQMKSSLLEWTSIEKHEVDKIAEISLREFKSLAGLENHTYTRQLCETMNNDERYELLEALFAIAAGDGNVESKETEEIRLISKGLNLEHRHFIAAKATVRDKLNSLRS